MIALQKESWNSHYGHLSGDELWLQAQEECGRIQDISQTVSILQQIGAPYAPFDPAAPVKGALDSPDIEGLEFDAIAAVASIRWHEGSV